MNTVCFLSIPATMFPEREILVFEQTRLTYGQVQDRVNRLANAMRSLGLRRGSITGILQTNCTQYVDAYYATSKLGGAFVPLNYRAKTDELRHMVSTAGVEALLVGDRYVELVVSLRAELPSVKHWISLERQREGMLFFEDLLSNASNDDVEEEMEGDEANIIMFTSGTTSLPKAVILSYAGLIEYIFETVVPAEEGTLSATLVAAPLYHVAGISAIMASIYGGRRLVLMSQFDASDWLHLVEEEKITNAFLVPTMLKRLLDDPGLETTDLSSLETLSYGAAPMPLAVIRRAIERLPANVGFINAFGQTETTATVTMLLPEDHRLNGSAEEVERKLKRLSSIGRPLPAVQLKIMDDDGVEARRGCVGEIVVRTPRLMKGYLGQDPQAQQLIVDGWMHTRDMGWIDEDGYVFLAGRKDDLIIRGGENIAPAEIEAVLNTHPSVDEAVVIGMPDEEWGESVMAVIVQKEGSRVGDQEIKDYCRERLASFKKPERVIFVESLPRNALGKVIRRELKAKCAFTSPR